MEKTKLIVQTNFLGHKVKGCCLDTANQSTAEGALWNPLQSYSPIYQLHVGTGN